MHPYSDAIDINEYSDNGVYTGHHWYGHVRDASNANLAKYFKALLLILVIVPLILVFVENPSAFLLVIWFYLTYFRRSSE